jgi:hypothetical protein
MKTTFKTILLHLLITFSGSVFAQPCLQISKQIDALKINIEKDRNVLSKLQANLRKNPRNLVKIQPQINKKINEIELQKTRKKKLQDQYQDCLVKNKLAKNKEEAKVIATTEKKMAKNTEIKVNNARGKAADKEFGDGSFVPIDKVKYTPAELAAKKKIKQDARNAEGRALNESAAVKAWKAEFKTTKTHTLLHTLNTVQLYSEFEYFLKTKFFTEENLYFYKTSKQTPASWNLRVIRSTYLSPKVESMSAISEISEKKDFTINIAASSIQQLNNAILASNFVATPDVIVLMGKAQQEVLAMLGLSTGPYYKFKQIMDGKANPPKKSRFSKK